MKRFILLGVLICQGHGLAAVTYYMVRDYKGRHDNPFVENSEVGTVYLEDFETQFGRGTNALTTPNVTGWNGGPTGSPAWGVQEDYASGDGMGWTWSDNVSESEWSKLPTGIHFDFAPDSYGRLPEYAGAALLGRVDHSDLGNLYNSILVYDKDGNEVTAGAWLLPRPKFSDYTAEDYFKDFAGIYVPGGISRIQFRDFLEVDHLTYGYAPIPEPGALSLAGVAAASLLRRRPRPRTI